MGPSLGTLRAVVCGVLAGSTVVLQAQSAKPAPKASAPATAGASGCSPSPAEMRTAAKAAAEKHSMFAADKAAGIDPNFVMMDMTENAVINDRISITVHFPCPLFHFGLEEAIRKREDPAAVPLLTTVDVSVSPSTIDAPDIIKIIVERDGKVVPPLASALKPKILTTRFGAKAVLHEGSVRYPCSAFAPGAKVIVTAIPESGSNFEIEINETTQIMYSPARKGLAFNLIGLQSSDIEARLGPPTRIDDRRL